MLLIPIYKAYIPEQSKEYARKALESSWISSIGEYVERATDMLVDTLGCKHGILINNGTSATHLVAKALAYSHPEVKRVLVPSACYVAAYNSLLYDNFGWKIKAVDLDDTTWNMRVEEVREEDAILAVHNLGNIINVPALKKKFGCVIAEDNCEGFFGRYEGLEAGTASLCSSMSFFGNKNITCGEGGAFLTNDTNLFEFITKVKGQGQTNKRYIHDVLGYNYRMTNVQAAILLGQLEVCEDIRKQKMRVFGRYRENLSGLIGIRLQVQESGTDHSMWMFGIRFDHLTSYDFAHDYFSRRGIETRPMFYPYTCHSHLKFDGDDSIAKEINNSVVVFPSYGQLTDSEIDYICEEVSTFSSQLSGLQSITSITR